MSEQNRRPTGGDMYTMFGTAERAERRRREEAQRRRQEEARPHRPPDPGFRSAGYQFTKKKPPVLPAHKDTAGQSARGEAVFRVKRKTVVSPSPQPGRTYTARGAQGGSVEVYGRQHDLQPARLPTFHVITKKNPVRKPFPTAIVFGALCCTVLLLFFIFNYMQLNEYTERVSALSYDLTALKQEEADLELAIVRRENLDEIEDYVKDRLGMIEAESIEKHYVTTISGDRTVVVTKKVTKELPTCTVELQ